MTSLLNNPITAASDDGVTKSTMPLARCQAVADTRKIIEITYFEA